MAGGRGHQCLAVSGSSHKGADRNGWICKAGPSAKMTGLVGAGRLHD